uniref:Uncharacterized protein n=1 Tax=Acrobeloides nanus TaxID=290746 RepID=A0A914DNY5_9BILA
MLQSVFSLPLLNLDSKMDQDYMTDMDKRDIEEEFYVQPPPSIAYLLQLPRTDRKNFETEAFLDALPDELIRV